MKQLKIKTVMVQCKNCIYFKRNEHGLCAFDQGLLHRDWDRKCNSFKQKIITKMKQKKYTFTEAYNRITTEIGFRKNQTKKGYKDNASNQFYSCSAKAICA